jgi:hypothetical protein
MQDSRKPEMLTPEKRQQYYKLFRRSQSWALKLKRLSKRFKHAAELTAAGAHSADLMSHLLFEYTSLGPRTEESTVEDFWLWLERSLRYASETCGALKERGFREEALQNIVAVMRESALVRKESEERLQRAFLALFHSMTHGSATPSTPTAAVPEN